MVMVMVMVMVMAMVMVSEPPIERSTDTVQSAVLDVVDTSTAGFATLTARGSNLQCGHQSGLTLGADGRSLQANVQLGERGIDLHIPSHTVTHRHKQGQGQEVGHARHG